MRQLRLPYFGTTSGFFYFTAPDYPPRRAMRSTMRIECRLGAYRTLIGGLHSDGVRCTVYGVPR